MFDKCKYMCQAGFGRIKDGCVTFKNNPYFYLYVLVGGVAIILMLLALALTQWSGDDRKQPGVADEAPFYQALSDAPAPLKKGMLDVAKRIELYAEQMTHHVDQLKDHIKNTDKKLALLQERVGLEVNHDAELDAHIEKEVSRQIAVYREKMRQARAAKKR